MNTQSIKQAKEQLLTIFTSALDAVNGRTSVCHFLEQNLLPTEKVWVAAVGKAANSMMLGVTNYLQTTGSAARLTAALVIGKQGHSISFNEPSITVIEADHPVPSLRSLEAGRRLVDFVKQIPETDTFLFLISGGASSLVEVLPQIDTSQEDHIQSDQLRHLQALNQLLLSNPWPINVINKVRQSVSCIKNGKLLTQIHTPHCIQLTISDVANNDLSIIGSGLLVQGTDPYSVIDIALPDWVQQMQAYCMSVNTQSPLDEQHVVHEIIADNAKARQAIANYANSIGLQLVVNETIEDEVNVVSKQIATTLTKGSPGLYVWGGETVVNLPENPGKGGRCQSLALYIAEEIKDHHDIVVLAIGTDGSDGPGEVAGALIDGMTIQRGLQLGLDSNKELADANAGYYLGETGDLIDTGPTGTNVMDLVIALKLPAH